MGWNLRELCYITAGLNIVGNLSGSIYYAVCCFLIEPDFKRQKFGVDNQPYGSFRIFLFLTICFGFVFYRNLEFLNGLRRGNQRAIASFIITMHSLMLILALRVYFGYLYEIYDPLPLYMRRDIGYIVFIGITLIPLYILYNDMKSDCYVAQTVDFSLFKCGTRHKATVVSTEEV